MAGSVLLKITFRHAQSSVLKIGMLMLKTACINPCGPLVIMLGLKG